MSNGVDDMYGSTGHGTRAILFAAGGYSTVDGHTGEENEKGIV